MSINKEINRNFGLSPEAFEVMLAQLRTGDETLFESIFLAHFGACLQFVKRRYAAPHDLAYDAVMWAMLKVRELLLANRLEYGNLESYMTRIAGNHYLKQQMRNREIPTDTFVDFAEEPEDFDLTELMPVLGKAWSKLGDNCQHLLQSFYYDKIELKQLTLILNDTSEANTRKKKERCLGALRKLFFESI